MERTFVLRTLTDFTAMGSLIANNWQTCAREGKFLAVLVTIYKRPRTPAQNKRYQGDAVLGTITEQAWLNGRQYDKESWHEFFKRKFIGVVDLPDGSTRGISTTTLDVEEFGQYMQKVEAFAAQELGVIFYDGP